MIEPKVCRSSRPDFKKRCWLTLHIRGGLWNQCKKTTPNQDIPHRLRTLDFDGTFNSTTNHNQTLLQENAALAVPCMWLLVGSSTVNQPPKPMATNNLRNHPAGLKPTRECNAQSGLVPPPTAIILYDFQPTPPAQSPATTRTARGPAYNQIILLGAAHSWGRRWPVVGAISRTAG